MLNRDYRVVSAGWTVLFDFERAAGVATCVPGVGGEIVGFF